MLENSWLPIGFSIFSKFSFLLTAVFSDAAKSSILTSLNEAVVIDSFSLASF